MTVFALFPALASMLVALLLATTASPGHALARATGGAAIALLFFSLAMSPLARLAAPELAVKARVARRQLGIASASVAIAHAALALPTYVAPLTLAPFVGLPWLRDGALALSILVTLLVTSFPVLQRALRVRAWSALHRLAYLAAIFASFHALGVPFGGAGVGLAACTVTVVLLIARPLSLAVRRRPESPADE